jgi:hypothetical protein
MDGSQGGARIVFCARAFRTCTPVAITYAILLFFYLSFETYEVMARSFE